ncbi:MAG: hypothetical protein ACK59A_05640 [Cyanobacteriota bacterium]
MESANHPSIFQFQFTMFFSFAPSHRSLSTALLGTVVAAGLSLGLQSPAQAIIPAYITIGSDGGNSPVNPSSYGFFFDAKEDVLIDALGFSSQPGWPTSGLTYKVNLWSFINYGAAPSDFTLQASVDFTPGTGVSYPFQFNYFWQSIAPVFLPESYTISDPLSSKGYVISAIGDFSGVGGAVQFEGGSPIVDPKFVLGGNGYSYITDTSVPPFYPIPIYDGQVGIKGYFNANLSYVPGPFPALAAAGAFGWARRLRQRVKTAK